MRENLDLSSWELVYGNFVGGKTEPDGAVMRFLSCNPSFRLDFFKDIACAGLDCLGKIMFPVLGMGTDRKG